MVTSRINNREGGQTPGTVLKVLLQRPSGGYRTVALTSDIVNLKRQLGAGGRQPPYACARSPNRTLPRCSDTYALGSAH